MDARLLAASPAESRRKQDSQTPARSRLCRSARFVKNRAIKRAAPPKTSFPPNFQIELRHLRYFQAVAEELNYSRAAHRLHIAQPALSRAVQELEDRLGAPLLERNTRTVRLTPAGEVLLRETGILLERCDEAIRRVQRAAAGEEGELRLGYIGPPTQSFFGRLLREYRARFPLVSIHLEERTPERVWEMLAKGRLSAALTRPVAGLNESVSLKTLPLREERLGAILPATHRLAKHRSLPWRRLANEPLVILARREGASLHDSILAACHSAGVSPRIVHSPSLIGTVLSYVEAGAGIGIAPDCVINPAQALRFVPLTPAASAALVLVWPEDRDTPEVQRFRELVSEWLAAGKLWPEGPQLAFSEPA